MTIFYAVPGESQILTGERHLLPKDAIQMISARPEQTDTFEIVAQADGTWGKKVYTDAEQNVRRAAQYARRTDPMVAEYKREQLSGASQATLDALAAKIKASTDDIRAAYPKAGEPGGA